MTIPATLGYILFFVLIFSSLGVSLAGLLYSLEHSERDPIPSARRRAQSKLKSCLDKYQLADYQRHRAFNVIGKRYIYRITVENDWVHAYSLDTLEQKPTFGYGPYRNSKGFPVEDVMLSKKLAIETDEERLLRRACTCPWPRSLLESEKLHKKYLPPEALLLYSSRP